MDADGFRRIPLHPISLASFAHVLIALRDLTTFSRIQARVNVADASIAKGLRMKFALLIPDSRIEAEPIARQSIACCLECNVCAW